MDKKDYLYNEKLKKIEGFRKNSLIDLHTHTYYSDGEMSPNELLKYAAKNNVGTISITDHDTILGLKNIMYSYGYGNGCAAEYVKIIPGIELSAKVDKGRMHILGYGIDINNEELNIKLNALKNNNYNYIVLLLAQLNIDYGISFSSDDIRKLFNSHGNLGRPDIAKLCMKYGYACNVQEAFDKYLIEVFDSIKNFKQSLTYEECIKLILNSGGIPILAHPSSLKLNKEELKLLILEMIKVGLKGIEVYHSSHSKEEEKLYLNIAKEYNLYISGGSDFHGKGIKPNVEIGTGINRNLNIKKLSLVNKIKNQI